MQYVGWALVVGCGAWLLLSIGNRGPIGIVGFITVLCGITGFCYSLFSEK